MQQFPEFVTNSKYVFGLKTIKPRAFKGETETKANYQGDMSESRNFWVANQKFQ